jgi:hypothetical protein
MDKLTCSSQSWTRLEKAGQRCHEGIAELYNMLHMAQQAKHVVKDGNNLVNYLVKNRSCIRA